MDFKETKGAAVQNSNEPHKETKLLTASTGGNGQTKAQGKPKPATDKALGKQPDPKPEPPQAPVMQMIPQKKALGLEQTLSALEELHRLAARRNALLARIEQLTDFEITQEEEADEMESNHFANCKLAIFDDKGRQFVTKSAGLIKLVAEFMKTACTEKLAEIEANIVFPQAA